MSILRKAVPLFLLSALVAGPVYTQDLRVQFGTKSSQCATAIDKTIKLSQAGDSKSALSYANKAVEYDPDCVMALYWLATINMDIGNVEEALTHFKKAIDTSLLKWDGEICSVGADACVSVGLTLSKLKQLEEGSYWLSREVILDPADVHKLHWKAYRNLAINSYEKGDGLSATIQALTAKELAPNRVSDDMLRELGSRISPSVAITLLTPIKAPTEPAEKRTHKSKLERVPDLEAQLNKQKSVTGMAHVFESNAVIIFSDKTNEATLFSVSDKHARTLSLPAPIKKAEGHGKSLFALTAAGTALLELTLEGQQIKSHRLTGVALDMSVCPRTRQAFLTINNMMHVLNLDSGAVTQSKLVGKLVACDPERQTVYTAYKATPEYQSQHLIVGGRPLFFNNSRNPDDDLDILMQGFYNKNGDITLCAVREKAAWNGYSMDISHNGRWITVTGGGGYRGPGEGGYGTGVLCTHSLGQLEGFYPCKAYSKSALFNPSTAQLAVLSSSELKVYDLGTAAATYSEDGIFSGAASWSPDGSLLLAYAEKDGIRAYANSVSTEEKAAYTKARKQMYASTPAPNGTDTKTKAGKQTRQAIPSLASFSPSSTLSTAKTAAQKAAALNPAESQGAPGWLDSPLYNTSKELVSENLNIRTSYRPTDTGISLFQVKQLLKKSPDFSPTLLLYGELLSETGQNTEAVVPILKALKADAGRSDISSTALFLLGNIFLQEKKDAQSLHCYATGLMLDAGHQATREAAAGLFAKYGFKLAGEEGKPLSSENALMNSSNKKSGIAHPEKHLKATTPIKPKELYATSASRSVSIQTDRSSGSGVCITEQGHILTCSHVVPEGCGEIRITTYSVNNGTASKTQSTTASVIYRDQEDDIAILKPKESLKSLQPLSLSKTDAQTGERVYALGSPGLGEQSLSQSLSEGIVSSGMRVLDGQSLIQHTAPTNPGNSGGPLLSEYGEIIGIVVLKANLENVAFAIPAKTIRKTLGWPLQ